MNCASNFASKVIFDCDDKLFMGVIMYIVLIESDAAPMTLSSWTIDQSFESEFETLDEAERTFMAKLRDLAKKYSNEKSKGKTSKESIESIYNDLKDQYRVGLKVEKDHKSGDPKQIVFDHLSEDPKYYVKLKKVEATEATGASSAGQYSSPSFLAKSMSPKKWRGKSKTQIPGGKFVEVKKKCKTFPYCNQGDINALNLSESKTMKRIIKNLSEKHGISESMVRNILIQDSKKNQK